MFYKEECLCHALERLAIVKGFFFMLEAAFNAMCSDCNPAWDIKFLDSKACTLYISVDPTVPSTGLGKW